MKKLNRKGFTLIELLAIIVILAIIMVVTIPTVLSSMGNARQSTFETSAQTVADWVEKNYTLARTLGEDDTDSAFLEICKQSNNYCSGGSSAISMNAAFLKAAGVDSDNYSAYTVLINNNGRACVTLTASLENNSDFKTLYTTEAGNKKANVAKSTGCD